MKSKSVVAYTFSMIFLGTSALAQDSTPSWKGQSVVNKTTRAVFADSPSDNATGTHCFQGVIPTKVKEEKDGWLCVFNGSRDGWVRKEQFILSQNAVAHFTRRIKSDSSKEFALLMRGMVYASEKMNEEAIKDLNEVLRVNPMHSQALNARARSGLKKRTTLAPFRILMQLLSQTQPSRAHLIIAAALNTI